MILVFVFLSDAAKIVRLAQGIIIEKRLIKLIRKVEHAVWIGKKRQVAAMATIAVVSHGTTRRCEGK